MTDDDQDDEHLTWVTRLHIRWAEWATRYCHPCDQTYRPWSRAHRRCRHQHPCGFVRFARLPEGERAAIFRAVREAARRRQDQSREDQ